MDIVLSMKGRGRLRALAGQVRGRLTLQLCIPRGGRERTVHARAPAAAIAWRRLACGPDHAAVPSLMRGGATLVYRCDH
jgi:hypothetical protein